MIIARLVAALLVVARLVVAIIAIVTLTITGIAILLIAVLLVASLLAAVVAALLVAILAGRLPVLGVVLVVLLRAARLLLGRQFAVRLGQKPCVMFGMLLKVLSCDAVI